MQPTLVLSALAQERAALQRSLDGATTDRLFGLAVVSGSLGGRPLVIGEIGIGKVNAASQVALLIDRHEPDLVVFTGVAGGLDPTLAIGDVVIATDVVQHDAGIALPDGFQPYQPGHVPFFNPTDQLGHSSAPSVLEQAQRAVAGLQLPAAFDGRFPSVVFGRVLSGDAYIHDPTTRERLCSELGGLVVEMEGGAVAQVADRMGVDHLVVRAVSDLAGEDSGIDFAAFLSAVAENAATVVDAIIGGGP